MWKWLRESALVCAFNPPDPIEFYGNHPLSSQTPDGIISSYIVQSLAKNFDEWTLIGNLDEYENKNERYITYREKPKILEHIVKKIKVKILLESVSRDGDGLSPWKKLPPRCTVNDVPIDEKDAEYIVSSYRKISEAAKKAKEAAVQAKKTMEQNEKKWNLAEDLLGMKRNKFGALVPKESVD